MKSIMQKEKECYMCRFLYDTKNTDGLEEHHVIHGTANRKMAEKYGVKVWLCWSHHMQVHMMYDADNFLMKEGQKAFEAKHTHEEWMKAFGKNWL